MRSILKKFKNKLLSSTKIKENSEEDNLDLNDICFFDEDGRLKELLERRKAKIIDFYKNLLIFNTLAFMCFLFFYSLTFNFLFIILFKLTLLIIFSIFFIKPGEMWDFVKDIWNA